jgi:hypothetical protein
MSDEVHVGDIGTIFRITVMDGDTPLDISTQTEMKIFLRRPDDTVLNNDAVHTTDGTDGKMEYVGVSGDVDQQGKWVIQGKIIIPEGTFYTDRAAFVVEESLAV